MLKSFASQLGKQQRRVPALSQARAFSSTFYNPKPQDEDSRPLDVRYWTGKSAVPFDKFQIDMSKYNVKKIISGRNEDGSITPNTNTHDYEVLKEHLNHVFDTLGVVHMINSGLTQFEEMRALSEVLKPKQMAYEGGANNRVPIEPNVYDTGAPKEADLMYHHEMAYVKDSCKYLSFCCLAGTHNPFKGATFVSMNEGVDKMLFDNPLGEKLKQKGMCYIRKLPDRKFFMDNQLDTSIVYNYWQTSFDTEDMDHAAEMAKQKGLEVEWQDSPVFGRYMVTKYYVDTFEYDPFTDTNTMFAAVADDYFWFQSWPGVRDLPHWEQPLKLNFGDDEVMTREEKQFTVDCYDANGVPVIWKRGDVAIVCNYRTAHGRPKYTLKKGERRDLGVILGETFERQGAIAEKW